MGEVVGRGGGQAKLYTPLWVVKNIHQILYQPTPKCAQECQKGYKNSYKQDKHLGANAYNIENDIGQIQQDIQYNGPLETYIDVYADFLHYKSGETI